MREKTIKLYQYAELSPDAQAKARDGYREASAGDYFSESVTDDFKETLKACGFSLSQHHGRDALYWSGFCSQGDGVSFYASWSASRVDVAALLADRPATYTDASGKVQTCQSNAELAVILQAFASLAADEPTGYGKVTGSNRGHSLICEWNYAPVDSDVLDPAPKDLTADFKELCNDLAQHFHRCLEREWEYQNSDEAVAETIVINEYEFLEDGTRA